MSFSVVGMSLEPYTLQIGTRIISKVSYLLTNKIHIFSQWVIRVFVCCFKRRGFIV